jgi:hypothetical protein
MGTGGNQPEVTIIHRLPVAGGGQINWATGGLLGLPMAARPAKEVEEKELVTTIVNEIRCYLAIDLEPAPTLERGVSQVEARE